MRWGGEAKRSDAGVGLETTNPAFIHPKSRVYFRLLAKLDLARQTPTINHHFKRRGMTCHARNIEMPKY